MVAIAAAAGMGSEREERRRAAAVRMPRTGYASGTEAAAMHDTAAASATRAHASPSEAYELAGQRQPACDGSSCSR